MESNVAEAQLGEEVGELGLGVGLGGGEVSGGETVVKHLAVGLLVEGLVGLGCPLAGFVERLGLGFVDEVVIQEGDFGERGLDAVALDGDGIITQLLHVDAQTQGAIINPYQLIIGKETLTNGVNHLLG